MSDDFAYHVADYQQHYKPYHHAHDISYHDFHHLPDDIHHTPCVDGVSARMEGSSSNPSIPQQEADNDGDNVDFEADFEDIQLDCCQAGFICPSMQ